MSQLPLPVELFLQIVESAPRPTQKTLLVVSKMFHDLACPLLFSRIALTFGIKRQPERHWDPSSPWSDEEANQLRKYNLDVLGTRGKFQIGLVMSMVIGKHSWRYSEIPRLRGPGVRSLVRMRVAPVVLAVVCNRRFTTHLLCRLRPLVALKCQI